MPPNPSQSARAASDPFTSALESQTTRSESIMHHPIRVHHRDKPTVDSNRVRLACSLALGLPSPLNDLKQATGVELGPARPACIPARPACTCHPATFGPAGTCESRVGPDPGPARADTGQDRPGAARGRTGLQARPIRTHTPSHAMSRSARGPAEPRGADAKRRDGPGRTAT